MENATIVFANTRTMMGNRYVVEKDTKALAGERDLPLPALVLGALKAFRALQDQERLALGEALMELLELLLGGTLEGFPVSHAEPRADPHTR
ncbi:hypothetical protein ACPCVO_46495 [Streptomyces umbrinus]|uniref:hypothetical protein n=1 Tax=Streptomyces umbrinus TaxID=67370 RepID=UPI003C2B0C83